MSCDLSANLECICNAIQELVAAQYAGSVGSNYLPASDQEPSDFVDTGYNHPEEFEDTEEYQQHKCNAAHTIFDDIRTDFVTLSTANIAGLTGALALAPLLVTGVPGVLLMTGYIILTTSLIIGTAFFLECIDALDDREDEIICAMVTAGTIQEAKNGFMSEMYAYPSWTSQLVAGTVGSLAEVWLNYTNLNLLFATDPTRDMSTGNDCSSCFDDVCPQFFTSTGILQVEDLEQATWLSVLSASAYRLNIMFSYDFPEGYCGSTVSITALVPSQTPVKYASEPIYRMFNQLGQQIGAQDTIPTTWTGCAWLAIVATQPIQYQVTWTTP